MDNREYNIYQKGRYIEMLCEPFSGNPRHDQIVRNIPNMTETEADKIIAELERDAPNEVTHGGNVYHQGKTSEHVKSISQNVD